MPITPLAFDQVGEIVDVYADAFYDYPVMRYTLGGALPYDRRLRRLVELFVSGRAYRGDPMFGIRDSTGILVGAAVLTMPRPQEAPPELLALRETTWAELGADARQRYDAFTAAAQRFAIPLPHYHLNMIGVRESHQGRGLARELLERVHDLSRADSESAGTSLTTERPANVRLYERFGYEVRGHARVGDGLETWTLFRENERKARSSERVDSAGSRSGGGSSAHSGRSSPELREAR